jgi:hypothetical protein
VRHGLAEEKLGIIGIQSQALGTNWDRTRSAPRSRPGRPAGGGR